MRIIYISYDPLPTEKAHGINIVKTCEAIASVGVPLELVMPRTWHSAHNDIFSFYKLLPVFTIRLLFSVDGIRFNVPYGFWIRRFSFATAVALSLCTRPRRGIVVLTRDEISAVILRMLRYEVFYDMHGFPETKRWFWKRVMRRMTGIITTNYWKKIECRDVFGIPTEKTAIAPNGFDPELFRRAEGTKKELRKELGLPEKGALVLYTGSLYDWKGAHVLLEAAKQFPISNFLRRQSHRESSTQSGQFPISFVFIGGNEKECAQFRGQAGPSTHIHVIGRRPYYDIPKFLKAADVLVLPNSARSKEARFAVYSQHDTSPIKLFEYMASGTPIVASSLSSIHEILHPKSALFVQPDNPAALIEGLRMVLIDAVAAERRAQQALADVKKYTWERRAERILEFIYEHSLPKDLQSA
ncbi:MAG: glycosyltransferase family 4 protein [Parcubacteria group bacterium]|nr:glycosyltransferase family 4 protein [Parcubacteria group bacterium]